MTAAPAPRASHSLRFRLLAATLLALCAALALSGLVLSGLFRDHVQRQFAHALTAQLDQLTARLEFDGAGQPRIDPLGLSDPRWSRPLSGLYWQLDRTGNASASAVLRSRSLWDSTLEPPDDLPAEGAVHVHEVAGPAAARLLLVERTVAAEGGAAARWRLMVAADLAQTVEAVARFDRVLAASLAILLLLLGAAAMAQVAVGLAPLRALQRALGEVHAGRAQRLDERFPAEVQPLVDDFNRVLDRNREIVDRARTQAGNLAHAVKTPLAALSQAAATTEPTPQGAQALAALVQEQVSLARRHVDWHLARSRAAAAHSLPGARTEVAPVVAGLIRAMQRVHAERGLAIRCDAITPGLCFAGEQQDLQELLGNLIDNACKWARSEVIVTSWASPAPAARRLHIAVDDDGPGIPAGRRERALARGARLDEAVPGSGLGLAIVQELAALYGGSVSMAASPAGGLRVELDLPPA